jgi:hypothetical protein
MALRTVHAQQPNFPEAIPPDKNDSVYCPNASACFRPGESVVLQPSITGAGETFSALATILDVRQKPEAGEVKEVLLSLYLPRHPDMRLRLDRPGDRTYIVYPIQHVVWTKYKIWCSPNIIVREAFLICPREIEDGTNDSWISVGMSNAYCLVGKWNHERTTGAFQSVGHGSPRLITPFSFPSILQWECTSANRWLFRRRIVIRIVHALSRSALSARTKENFKIDGVTEGDWSNFQCHTINATEKNGLLTFRANQGSCNFEVLKTKVDKLFARFDTSVTFLQLKEYFGQFIHGSLRARSPRGPDLLQGTSTAFRARRNLESDSIGMFAQFSLTGEQTYYSKKPGIDFLYVPFKAELTCRLRFVILKTTDDLVRTNLLSLPPLPVVLANVGADSLIQGVTEFEENGTLYVVEDLTYDGSKVLCHVQETDDDELTVGEERVFPLTTVLELVEEYNGMDED